MYNLYMCLVKSFMGHCYIARNYKLKYLKLK
jgi:hypothetical protein